PALPSAPMASEAVSGLLASTEAVAPTSTESNASPVLDSGVAPEERLVPTPVLGLLTTQALLRNGYGAEALPGPLAEAVGFLAPQVQQPERRAIVRAFYRVFRAWLLFYYSPDELLALGISL
ncbi:MAG: hypothetical protein NZM11_13670, partial [Anaerolineales bacterium]|nr:hypothetical protein [Anaerolineales bacterium]